jgi:hypothetical protein
MARLVEIYIANPKRRNDVPGKQVQNSVQKAMAQQEAE